MKPKLALKLKRAHTEQNEPTICLLYHSSWCDVAAAKRTKWIRQKVMRLITPTTPPTTTAPTLSLLAVIISLSLLVVILRANHKNCHQSSSAELCVWWAQTRRERQTESAVRGNCVQARAQCVSCLFFSLSVRRLCDWMAARCEWTNSIRLHSLTSAHKLLHLCLRA